MSLSGLGGWLTRLANTAFTGDLLAVSQAGPAEELRKSLANCVQEEKVSRRPHFAEQRSGGESVNLLIGDMVEPAA